MNDHFEKCVGESGKFQVVHYRDVGFIVKPGWRSVCRVVASCTTDAAAEAAYRLLSGQCEQDPVMDELVAETEKLKLY